MGDRRFDDIEGEILVCRPGDDEAGHIIHVTVTSEDDFYPHLDSRFCARLPVDDGHHSPLCTNTGQWEVYKN